MPSENVEYTGKVIKKLLPDKLAGKSYKKTNNNIQWIVVHNMGGMENGQYKGGTNSSSYNWWSQGAGGANTSAHYCVDDKEIWQCLEDKWTGHHAGQPKKGQYGADRGASNNNSIGIEISDGNSVDKDKAIELGIELIRYLVKKYGLSVDNVIQHYDVSGKNCPQWIRTHNKWNYIKQQVETRNKENKPISFDVSTLTPGGDTTNQNGGTGGDINFDNRENLNDIQEVKGIVLVNMPPYHFVSLENKEEEWAKEEYKKEFHYLVDSSKWNIEKEKNLIAFGLQENDRHTYIDRALFENKPYKYTLNIGLFTSHDLKDYTVTEKLLIDNTARVLHENGLKTKHLWREFDLNREPSPFMYLDREQWKKFLREIDKQVEWRYKNFGEPDLPEKTPTTSKKDDELLYKNKGKKGNCSRSCSLREQPNMTGPTIKTLEEGTPVQIIDYNPGYYKVKAGKEETEGWIVYSSVKVSEEGRKYIFKSKDNKIPKPEIVPTMTHKEYEYWKSLTDPTIIDEFAGKCEPYDKGLPEIIEAPITNDDRLEALTKEQRTRNESTIYYGVVEGSPGGDGGHCVQPAAELNALYKPDLFKVDPIYPDLIVPPNYATTDNNKAGNKNPIPLTALQENSIKEDKDFDNLTFDFDLLKEMNKKSKGKPVNYLDAYPYDDKVYELEKHSPKIKIDEIESRLYECNHPGCPIAQPMAKNFAMLNDMALNQSRKIESRIVRLENTLSFVLRSLGRVGARINVNCVYYGGQDTFGKYKTIRCLRDDRIHDACSVTLDQCLSCTRYEPIVGQIYEILDDTGMNGSTVLDDMQMSYMSKEDYIALNRVENRNIQHKYANVNKDEKDTPKTITSEWEEEDKNKHIETLKKTITNEEELKKKMQEVKQEDYAFKMNWELQDLDVQEPDVKLYPTEGIAAKFTKTNFGDAGEGESEKEESILDKTDEEWIEDLDKIDKLNKGEWVDTREEADTIEMNKYSSEDYYFEDFNKMDIASGGSPGSSFAAEARKKICDMALQIVNDHAANKACYHQGTPSGNRTVDYSKPVTGGNSYTPASAVRYDCSSMVSCCYKNAGLTSVYNKNTDGQVQTCVSNKSEFWLCNQEGVAKALPGDLIYVATSGKVTQGMLGKFIDVKHVLIYMGDSKVAHASTPNKPVPNQIRYEKMDWYLTGGEAGNCFFVRPKDLMDADAAAAATSGGVLASDVNGITNGSPSSPLIRSIKGKEGYSKYGTPHKGESFNTGGYGIAEPYQPEYYNKLKPFPVSEQKATTVLIDCITNNFAKPLYDRMKKDGIHDKVKQHQFDALCSIAMNCGLGGLTKTNLWTMIKQNPNNPQIPEKIKTFKATQNGVTSNGLLKRRKMESEIYSSGKYQFSPITIIEKNGSYNGTVTDNKGHGWMPNGWSM